MPLGVRSYTQVDSSRYLSIDRNPPRNSKTSHAPLCVLTALSVTHLSIGRTGYTAIAISLITVAFFNFRSFQRYWMAAAIVLFIATLAATSTQLQDRVKLGVHEVKTTSHNEITSLGARVLMWKMSLESIKKSPIIGHGTGSYHSLAEKAFDDPAWCSIVCFHPHNQFLFFGVEHGVIGILIYIFYFYRPLKFALNDASDSRPLFLSFLGIFALNSLTHGAMWLSVENHFFTFIMALFMANANNIPHQTSLK
jgi:O-antigen ligase